MIDRCSSMVRISVPVLPIALRQNTPGRGLFRTHLFSRADARGAPWRTFGSSALIARHRTMDRCPCPNPAKAFHRACDGVLPHRDARNPPFTSSRIGRMIFPSAKPKSALSRLGSAKFSMTSGDRSPDRRTV